MKLPAGKRLSFSVFVLAAFGLFSPTSAKGGAPMPNKPLIDTRIPAQIRTATFAMG